MVNEIMEIGRCRRSSGQSTYSFPSIGLQCSENEWRTNGERCSRVNNSRFHKTPLSTQRIEVARRVTLPSEFDWNPGEYRESVEFPMNKSRQTIAWSWMDVFKRFKINKQASFHIPEIQIYHIIYIYTFDLRIFFSFLFYIIVQCLREKQIEKISLYIYIYIIFTLTYSKKKKSSVNNKRLACSLTLAH